MERREFLLNTAGLLGAAAPGLAEPLAYPATQVETPAADARFEWLSAHVGIYRDVVNVGVIRQNGKILLIDCGEGLVMRDQERLGLDPLATVLFTHYHRDQCSGASRLQKAGAKIGVPASEALFFHSASEFWRESDKILDHRYNFRPEMLVLRESVPPDFELKPDEAFEWEGIPISVLSTPGHSAGSVTYLATLDGNAYAFTGDLTYGAGKIWEFYSLQSRFPGMPGDYWGFGAAVAELVRSLDAVWSRKPTLLVPSHGSPIKDPGQAMSQLKTNLQAAMRNYFTTAAWRIYFSGHFKDAKVQSIPTPPYDQVTMIPPLPPPRAPSWMHKMSQTSSYIRAEDGSMFLFDCGFAPIVAEIDRLVASGVVHAVDGIWISHYHDDHVNSVNEVRRKYGARVYVQREMQDILENPTAYNMPCLFPESIHVDHALREGEVVYWKGYKMSAYHFPGQTLFHDGLLIEYEGATLFMTGDSFANWGIDDYCSYNRNFIGKDGATAGYERCLRLLLKLKPDLLFAAHWGPLPVSEAYLHKTLELLQEREKLFSVLFPWENVNFGLDPSWVRAYPYRQSILPGQTVAIEARIFNHGDSPRLAQVELRAPGNWHVEKPGGITIPPHSEGHVRLTAVAPANPLLRREVLGLAVHFGQINLGEITEAVVDYRE